MKVSIIVPVYNVAKYIERCLLSVLDQTWQDLEAVSYTHLFSCSGSRQANAYFLFEASALAYILGW